MCNNVEDIGLNEADKQYNKMNILAVVGILTKGLREKIEEKSERKHNRKTKIDNMALNFREKVGGAFFTEILHIEKFKINNYLNKLQFNEQFISLYLEDKIIECIDFLLKERKESLKNATKN